MTKVLVVATSRKTRGGITAVLRLYEQSPMWQHYACRWVETHRDGPRWLKVWYLIKGMAEYMALLPFYDVVHIHFSLPVSARRKYPFFRLAKWMGKKTVLHLHCGSQIDEIWSPMYQKMFSQCDCTILLSQSLRRKIASYIGETGKLKVVYNPCPVVGCQPQMEKKNYILFSGTLIEKKGYKDLIRAFAQVASRFPDWKIVFAGNGEENEARTLAAELGIASQVELLGWVNGERKHQAFSEARVLCLPSYAEGFPMAVLDAWAYGLPVVTTPVGGIPDVAVDGQNMFLFQPGDVDTLARQLDRIISDAALRQRLSTESLRFAREQFNLTTVTQQLAAIYEELKGS